MSAGNLPGPAETIRTNSASSSGNSAIPKLPEPAETVGRFQNCRDQRKQWGRFCYVSQSETAEPSPAVSADKASAPKKRTPDCSGVLYRTVLNLLNT